MAGDARCWLRPRQLCHAGYRAATRRDYVPLRHAAIEMRLARAMIARLARRLLSAA